MPPDVTTWLDSLPSFDAASLPTTFTTDADRARTDGRLAHRVRRGTYRARCHVFVNARKQHVANAILEQLPSDGEALHVVLDGAFDLCHLIPRVIELAGEICQRLDLATLGFNDATADILCRLSDAGQIRQIRLLCSHYFKSVDTELWSRSHAELTKRGHTMYVARSHAKLQLYQFESGRTITLMSSANLRSCKNAEFVILFADGATLAFWRDVMDELIQEAKRCEAMRQHRQST